MTAAVWLTERLKGVAVCRGKTTRAASQLSRIQTVTRSHAYLKDWRKKKKRVNGLPGAFVQQDPRYGQERGRLRVYSLRFFGTFQWRISSVRTLLGIWTIIFRLEIFLGFWKELALTWSSVHNGLRLVWLVWPPAHLLPHIFQISSCKRPDYYWLVKTSVNSTASYIFFYFIKIHKSLFGSRQDEAFFPSSPSACKGEIQVLQHSHLLTEQPQQGLFSLKQT